jgi:hypothetical protein
MKLKVQLETCKNLTKNREIENIKRKSEKVSK